MLIADAKISILLFCSTSTEMLVQRHPEENESRSGTFRKLTGCNVSAWCRRERAFEREVLYKPRMVAVCGRNKIVIFSGETCD